MASKGEPDFGAGETGAALRPPTVIFFTVFAQRAEGGGVYFVDEPPGCAVGDFSVGGSIGALPNGKTVELLLNGADPLVLTANDRFAFPKKLPDGAEYNVTMSGASECRIESGASGRIHGEHVEDIVINCLVPG